MRVAQRMISRNYRRTVNSSLKKQADTLERSESGLKFKRLSDNVAAGNRAMHLQEERYQATQQLENTKDLIAEMKSVDSNMDSIHSVLQKLQERILMGMSEDYGADAREVISKEVASKKDQLLQFINNQFGGKYLFAGTNNSVQPFTEGEDGKLCFNGIPVEQIWKSTEDGKYYYGKPVTSEEGNWFQMADGTMMTKTADNPDGTMTYTDTNGLTYTLGADGTTWTEDAGGTALAAAPTAVTMNEFTMFGNTVYKDVAETGGETYRDATGAVLYQKDANGEYTLFTDAAGNTFTKVGDQFMDAAGNPYEKTEDGTYVNIGSGATLDVSAQPEIVTTPTVVPNSEDTYADIGLGLKISGDMTADPRTAFQVSFSGLTLTGCAKYDPETGKIVPITGDRGTEVAGNIYDLLTQIEGALHPEFDKAALDDMFTQLVNLTDNVGMTRTDLGNRMEYLELTESRLEDDIADMTELETGLISSDPAEEAIKMKECEYVWLAVMQLGSKVLPTSLLDFMS